MAYREDDPIWELRDKAHGHETRIAALEGQAKASPKPPLTEDRMVYNVVRLVVALIFVGFMWATRNGCEVAPERLARAAADGRADGRLIGLRECREIRQLRGEASATSDAPRIDVRARLQEQR